MSSKAASERYEQSYVCPNCRRVLVVCAPLSTAPWCMRCNKRMIQAPAGVTPGQRVLFKDRFN